ncbi:uncharacterized protein CIMG_12977 [Coccidioides immitis RS]|uniref:Uncharacterized protein n=1 Tax=Coccidioides immitis (strain RS) TaxID=246410 RepID=A0A0D8JT31_COCIM|nr:uncharacterized protein CIMG_12977 [Coccidioides immitis RS]KJF60452.1 hypothetical protein CIMG_12977 [Coccidioides immitis RS]
MTTGGANGKWTQRDVVNGKERTATRWAKLLMESAMREEMKGLGRERVCERKERKMGRFGGGKSERGKWLLGFDTWHHPMEEEGEGLAAADWSTQLHTCISQAGVIKPPLVRIPGQNIQVPEAWGGDWPRVADLVILLQRVTDKPSLKAGGGSVLPGT